MSSSLPASVHSYMLTPTTGDKIPWENLPELTIITRLHWRCNEVGTTALNTSLESIICNGRPSVIAHTNWRRCRKEHSFTCFLSADQSSKCLFNLYASISIWRSEKRIYGCLAGGYRCEDVDFSWWEITREVKGHQDREAHCAVPTRLTKTTDIGSTIDPVTYRS